MARLDLMIGERGNWRLWGAQLYLVFALLIVGGLTAYCCIDFARPGLVDFIVTRLDWHHQFFWWVFVIALFALWLFMRGFLELRDYLREKDNFIRASGHDLLTPLVGLRATIGRDDAEAKLLIERLLHLVDNLRSFVHLGQRRAPTRERFALGDAFREAYAIFAADYRELLGEDVALVGDADVIADRTLVVQILWNLLGNDLKYAAPHGAVRAAIHATAKGVVFDLIDEGPGMTSREQRHAFDRYYRAKSALKTGQGGFGIGLCIAREFARAMGGELSVTANAPHGCVFSLRLADF